MTKRPLKPKKFTPSNLSSVDPLPVDSVDEQTEKIVGIFTGLSVEVCNPEAMLRLSFGGCFGQGTLSRSFPVSVRNHGLANTQPKVTRERQLERRKEWKRKYDLCAGNSSEDICVMDEETEKQLAAGIISRKQLKHVVMRKQENPFPVAENLSLGYEETLFLIKELKCLEVRTLEGLLLPQEQLIERFVSIKRSFIPSYVAFIYLKARNWVIKSGLKFGGDFLIYHKGPQFFHASYVVLVQPYRDNERLGNIHYMDNHDFQAFNRIAETTAKDLLILEVHYPTSLDPADYVTCMDRLTEFKVSETFPKHHNPTASRNKKDCK
ncbi:tRNA-splicing endonuclease subunit Sen2 [Toxorhynchites rutilus septentrionalis]|uniref:tRNA-splicing endonuclease subunit Sen2 n=1 Tax=Toxorhynchites rutilus septentrionalis TaxID=329112 RepID=UPI00247A81BB|nr:tRNA-splicing endonuclease subunit Sen2 [Toxorhynchites rutilus septentrionalis]